MPQSESTRPLHCVELVTGKNLTGTVLILENELRADICSYTDHFYIESEEPVFPQTVTNEIVSLHSNVTTVPGTSTRSMPSERRSKLRPAMRTLRPWSGR